MPGAEVAVVGSANLDLVVEVETVPLVGETVLGGDLDRIPGGKGANQAVAAARLGRRVAMIGRVGDDEGGAILRAALESDGVDCTHLATTAGVPNGVALIAVGADGDNAIVVSPGANGRVAIADIDAAAAVLAAAPVTLLQLEVPLDAVEHAAHTAGGTVVLNPAPAPPAGLPPSLLESVDVLVPNQTELATLAGGDPPADADAAVALARTLPIPNVVVTLGAEGALVVTPTRPRTFPLHGSTRSTPPQPATPSVARWLIDWRRASRWPTPPTGPYGWARRPPSAGAPSRRCRRRPKSTTSSATDPSAGEPSQ